MLPRHVKPNLVTEVKSQINVTPLVDVCLVLLIIFMVVTPLLQKGVAVTLPETANPSKMPENAKQLTMAINADGAVFVNQNWVPKESLKATLAQVHECRLETGGALTFTQKHPTDDYLRHHELLSAMAALETRQAGMLEQLATLERKIAGTTGNTP